MCDLFIASCASQRTRYIESCFRHRDYFDYDLSNLCSHLSSHCEMAEGKEMKYLKYLLLIASFGLVACSNVPYGHVGIIVSSTGSNKGVEPNIQGTGWYWLWPTETMYIFPTFKQNYTWTANEHEGSPRDEHMTFNTGGKDNVQVDIDLGISYTVDPAKIVVLFQKYQKGIDEITHIYIKNYIRDALNKEGTKYSLEQVMGDGKVKMLEDVKNDVNKILIPEGLTVEQVYMIGHLRPPQIIVEAINNKIKAVQEAEQSLNEVQKVINEASKKREEAKGIRDANQIKAASLTENLIRWEAILKWDGKLPLATGGNMPLLNLK